MSNIHVPDASPTSGASTWRAEARSGWLLASGVIVGLGCMVAGVPNVWTANLLLASLYFAELLRLTLQVVAYRRGF